VGEDLEMRWLVMFDWRVAPSDDPVNYVLTQNADGNWEQKHVGGTMSFSSRRTSKGISLVRPTRTTS